MDRQITQETLDSLTTRSMICLGEVYHNLMVDLEPVNQKLVERSKRLIKQAGGCTEREAAQAFAESGKRPKAAIALEEQSSGPISEMICLYQGRNSR